ncbi:MAG: hypothetical protein LBE59_02085 [Nevskiaceae bacterium]|jgi:hypothetical protein|nr:hypothetical protein [Nevskiaceae bacterium]
MSAQLPAKHPAAGVRLPRYDEMCTAIAACHRVDEAKNMRDKAEALRAYAKQANNKDAEVQLAEIKVRAERKCGELLRDMAMRGERATKGKGKAPEMSHDATFTSDRKSRPHDATARPTPPPETTLKDIGITRDESSRFQQVAAVPEKKFEAHAETVAASLDAVIQSLERIESDSAQFIERAMGATPEGAV